jgi:Fe-Mn family superoxide dismutase
MSERITLRPLPYAEDALAPVISARTVSLHYGQHHKTYVDNVNRLVAGTDLEGQTLEEIIAATGDQPNKTQIFNNVAQAWNHDFYWRSLTPKGGGKPPGELAERIAAAFGGYAGFRRDFVKAAQQQFGSGWVWLVTDANGLSIVKTSNAQLPRAPGQRPLLTVDVWEHAYYLDYNNRRVDYVDTVLERLIDWNFAIANLSREPTLTHA